MDKEKGTLSPIEKAGKTNLEPSKRILSIDALRGFVVLLMTLDHVRDGFHPSGSWLSTPMDLSRVNSGLFWTRTLTHLCAPVFTALAGASVALMIAYKPMGKAQLRRFLLTRGLVLVVLDFTVVRWGFSLVFDYSFLGHLTFGVLGAIGVALCFFAFVQRLSWQVAAFAGLALCLGHNLLPQVPKESIFSVSKLPELIYSFLFRNEWWIFAPDVRLRALYPVLPWLGSSLLGYALAKGVYLQSKPSRQNLAQEDQANRQASEHSPVKSASGQGVSGQGILERRRERRMKQLLLLFIGISFLGLFATLRLSGLYGDPSAYASSSNMTRSLLSFFNVSKYPASAHYFLLTLGLMSLLLAFLERGERLIPMRLVEFGRAPLFYYLAHLFMIVAVHRVLGWWLNKPPHYDLPTLSSTWLLSLAVIVLMAPLNLAFQKLKKRSKSRILALI